jgi:7,8-dihydropterin-6-yl-methyl-4-(beta-D-ribofuranosyl)aminobenzene 5'-phosphate synthase
MTILTDNETSDGGLLAEHGLSILVERGAHRLLFDTGQSDLCRRNAARLGRDLAAIETVVLSHGHYDHGGGLPGLLEHMPGPLEVIVHPHAFAPRYVRHPGQTDRFIGLSYDLPDLAHRGACVRLEAEPREVGPRLLASGPIPHQCDFELDDPQFITKTANGWEPDRLEDDQALVALTAEGLVVLLGCAHAGVVNTLHHAMRLAGERRLRAVVGGLHLVGADAWRIEQTVAALQAMAVRLVVACHCTGDPARQHLHAALGDRYVNGAVGMTLAF